MTGPETLPTAAPGAPADDLRAELELSDHPVSATPAPTPPAPTPSTETPTPRVEVPVAQGNDVPTDVRDDEDPAGSVVPGGNRWRLHRGGIINIWQYGVAEFDFSGGRAIFQGTNGSGKSRTLELLLPLCLDGDLRQLGSKGFDTVSIRRLMLDDYDGGSNRIGYAWVELRRRVDPAAGNESGYEYLTCGIGVKASTNAQQITDSWRFVTPLRVRVDVPLVAAGEVPLSQPQLREALGPDAVLEDAAFRARIAESVYGMPAGRYGDLLHLQRTLRNPDVGLKVLEGQLEQILSDALPPLDASMIGQLATSFEDLESIRENITRLSTADSALSAFLGSYSGYAGAALKGLAEKAQSAASALEKSRTEVRRLAERLDTAREQHAAAEQASTELDARDVDLEQNIQALKENPAYQGLRDLRDRQRLVDAARDAAATALDHAAGQRAQEDRQVESVLAVLRRLEQDCAAAVATAERTREQLAAAGLDPYLCPMPPLVPVGEPGRTQDRVRAKPDPEAEPLPLDRRTPPALHIDVVDADLQAAAEQADAVIAAARRQVGSVDALYNRAVELDRRRQSVDDLRRAARQAQIDATESAGQRNESGQRLHDAAAVWLDSLAAWTSATAKLAAPTADAEDPHAALPDPPSVADLVADADAVTRARTAAREWLTPRQRAAQQRVLAAEQRLAALTDQSSTVDAELAALRQGVDPEPPRPSQSRAERDTSTGAPFYRLVDFAPEVSAAERAGLEAALTACGLLNAWVPATGTPGQPGTALADLLPELYAAPITADRGTPTTPLSTVLIPAVGPDSPVPTALLADLLDAVALADSPADHPATGLTVSLTGHWRAGVLTGVANKPEAEYVGAGARDTARERRLADVTARQESLTAQRKAATAELRAATQDVTAWERQLASYPDDQDLRAAHSRVTGSTELAAKALDKAQRLREEHQHGEAHFQAVHTEFVQDAAQAGLPADTSVVSSAHRAATEARASAEQLADTLRERCRRSAAGVVDALHEYQTAVAERTTAEANADAQCASYATEAAALDTLTDAVGGEAEQVSSKLRELELERQRVRKELPAARKQVTELSNQAVKLETQLEGKRGEIDGKEHGVRDASNALRAALSAPGVWSAAVPDQAEIPDDATEVAAVLSTVERRPASEETVIGKLQALQGALAGSHNITPERHAGILTVVVAGEEGPRPVADAARHVRELLAVQRGYLNEQYQDIFATYLLRNLSERLHNQIAVAEDLCRRMNAVLDQAKSSQGVHVQLEWQPAAALDDATLQALHLVRTPFADRTPEQDVLLRKAFTERIEAERDGQSGGYAEILTRALDYRSWYSFTVRVRDLGPDGKPRTRRLRQLSSGETRLISYVTLFAAAAAFYGAVSGTVERRSGATVEPLRLVLLDEAFERLDDPTIARMLELLVELDMDWLITWPSGWGVSSKIPRMHIYDILRPKSGRGVACTQTTWDGASLDRNDP